MVHTVDKHWNTTASLLSFLSGTGIKVLWMYWHQCIAATWVTREPSDRRACLVYNSLLPFSSVRWGGGCTSHAGSKCTNWYLAVTHLVLQISCEHPTMFLCPESGNTNRLTPSQLSFSANPPHSNHAQKQKNLDLVIFCCGVFPTLSRYIDGIIRSRPWQEYHNYRTFPPCHQMDWTWTAQTCRGFLLWVQPRPLLWWTW